MGKQVFIVEKPRQTIAPIHLYLTVDDDGDPVLWANEAKIAFISQGEIFLMQEDEAELKALGFVLDQHGRVKTS